MSEQNSNPGTNGTFNIFESGPLDLGSASLPDPFAVKDSEPPAEEIIRQPEAPQPPAAPVQQAAPAQAAPAQSAEAAADGAEDDGEPENLLSAAVAQAEAKQAAVTADALFSKAPVFEYAAAKEEIKDASITFEQLRIEKASDFPELDDSKRVSWTMEYCSIVKQVPTPAKTVIGTLKKEIENSKEFLEALKKAKDKNPICRVKPKITAQSKGIASYKGIFPTMEEADASDKAIRILPARDGYVYEIRCTEAGKFIARAANVQELSAIDAGFVPAFPPLPFGLFAQVLAFFRHFMRDGRESEVMVYIYWDKEEQEYRIRVPMQKVGKASISVIIPPDETFDADRYVHVADIHSHNSMPAYFSGIDDKDELATRAYVVVGGLNQTAPAIAARISVGGRFVIIDARQVVQIATLQADFHPVFNIQRFEYLDDTDFPPEWISMVHVMENTCNSHAEAYDIPIPVKRSLLAQCLYRLKGRAGDRKVRDYEI